MKIILWLMLSYPLSTYAHDTADELYKQLGINNNMIEAMETALVESELQSKDRTVDYKIDRANMIARKLELQLKQKIIRLELRVQDLEHRLP